ncbi:hypothetical protein [Salipiger thiooxidans]|uniref:hypothetical protein n=1 Tax=Salipiger thiooxidans TaxID=282683 RepID=UPI001CFB6108|nr:hypothetical protein [Salipiger thiooxidans]
MRCRYCGTDRNLLTEPYQDEDGFVSDEPIELCHDCVEISEERRKARAEWNYYHPGEPCPEVELPQPAPRRWTDKERE